MIGTVGSASFTKDMVYVPPVAQGPSHVAPQAAPIAQQTLTSEGAPVQNVDFALQISAMNAALDVNRNMGTQLVNMAQAIGAYTGNPGSAGTGSTIGTVA
ncbi:MAG: hypothetical protein ABFD98_17920 [Syntrophobacteraceae bacterium]